MNAVPLAARRSDRAGRPSSGVDQARAGARAAGEGARPTRIVNSYAGHDTSVPAPALWHRDKDPLQTRKRRPSACSRWARVEDGLSKTSSTSRRLDPAAPSKKHAPNQSQRPQGLCRRHPQHFFPLRAQGVVGNHVSSHSFSFETHSRKTVVSKSYKTTNNLATTM
jgi:hypothetical protein